MPDSDFASKTEQTAEQPTDKSLEQFDVVVVGAGFAGMYLLHRLRGAGFTSVVLETADDVGGTWYWNRYPGARCDVESIDYSFSFDPELERAWQWSEKYATQPEILRYAQFVADRYDLRRDIRFGTRVESAVWDEVTNRWTVKPGSGAAVSARFYVMATGCLSMPKDVDIEGVGTFKGATYWTSRWPHEGVDVSGKRVAVIGTGSSAIQSIPHLAASALELTIFQRTPNFSIPAHNGPHRPDKVAAFAQDRDGYRTGARQSGAGVPIPPADRSTLAVSDEERQRTYEAAWSRGGIIEFTGTFNDHGTNPDANEKLSEFVRSKIRATVKDPVTAEALCPRSFPIGTKRLCVDTGYYETFNQPNVRLVDLNAHPLKTISEHGVELIDETVEADVIVFATGFDAMTGAIVAVDIRGRGGVTLADSWAAGPRTYLGLQVEGFPNLFLVTGPGSPSVLSNMIVSIEQHVNWITDCLIHMRAEGLETIEPGHKAVEGWVEHVNAFASITLFPKANSWYMGANVPGKPRVFLPYLGGVDRYRIVCEEVVDRDYFGFVLSGPGGEIRNDGVVRSVQPDVGIMLDLVAQLGMPPLESLPAADARAMMQAGEAMRAPGPAVGETVALTIPGAEGPLGATLHRPATGGPHPIVVWFHGGGWVLGSKDSDDPFCRFLCVSTNSVVISVDYRHAPEHRFPAAANDAFAAAKWVAEHAAELGGSPDSVSVGGWSAGGNLAAGVCLRARDEGGPKIARQVLVCPVTDTDTTRPSYQENGVGFALSASLMRWFIDQYTDESQRSNPLLAPLRASSLAGLPPAVVVTCQFDPLRDEGDAYAGALAAAGVKVKHIRAHGHIHTSLLAVDALPTGAPVRAELAEAFVSLLA